MFLVVYLQVIPPSPYSYILVYAAVSWLIPRPVRPLLASFPGHTPRPLLALFPGHTPRPLLTSFPGHSQPHSQATASLIPRPHPRPLLASFPGHTPRPLLASFTVQMWISCQYSKPQNWTNQIVDVIHYPNTSKLPSNKSTVSISFQDHAVFTMISGLPAMATFQTKEQIELNNNREVFNCSYCDHSSCNYEGTTI